MPDLKLYFLSLFPKEIKYYHRPPINFNTDTKSNFKEQLNR
jgi:hypothetical protein